MSLLTPPRTAHKDKENQPPTPTTPSKSNIRTSRIAWSQENLHHAYTTDIRQLPSSSCAQGPQKSILKKPSHSIMPSEQRQREATPEPPDPLKHPLYLNSPVSTLVASLKPSMDAKITLTDLTEAYSVLSARLKTKTEAMLNICGPIPALEPLREFSVELVESFCRDIRRARADPQSGPPLSNSDSPWSTPSSVGSAKRDGFTAEEVKYARDLCNLCHAAMRCFSNISVVPVLYSMFTDIQIGNILTEILAILLATSLPTPNARKTRQIAMWCLSVQRLSAAVLLPAADRITYALRRGIDGELGREGKKGASSDGLKAVIVLASYQPTVFLTPFTEILPSILTNLTSQNPSIRGQAAHALLACAYSLAHLSSPSMTLLTSFSQAATRYLDEEHDTHQTSRDSACLGRAMSGCLNAEISTHAAHSPMWALSVIAAIIILVGGDTLTHPRVIKFVLAHLEMAMAVKRTTVRATAGLVWRALVWACVQLDNSHGTEEKKRGAWRVVCQIVDGAIGVSIVAALIGRENTRPERVSQALGVLLAMIRKGGKTCEEAVDVLERMLSGVGNRAGQEMEVTWADGKLLAKPLFDGTLLQVEWKNIAVHVKEGLRKSVTIRDVRQLRGEEVNHHWNACFGIWKAAVERAPLGEDGEIPPPLLNSWHALLLIQAQAARDYENLTFQPMFISQLTGLLTSFLTGDSLGWSLDPEAPSSSSQTLKLGFVRNLWTVLRDVFTMPAIGGVAESLLSDVLKLEYHLEQKEVRGAWTMLCAELVLAGGTRLARALWEEPRISDADSGLKKVLWDVVSHQWVIRGGSWEGAIELLRVPFANPARWVLDRDDLDGWVRLVEHSILTASTGKISPNIVLDAIAHEISADQIHTFIYTVLPFLLSGVDISESQSATTPLPVVLLKITNEVLANSYPPIGAEIKPMIIRIVDCLREIVKSAPKELLVELLLLIQGGSKLWIEDRKHVFTDQEFNQQIIPFYLASLEGLGSIPVPLQSMHKLMPLLVSAFSHIPEPALGPSAFKDFWVGRYKIPDQSDFDYPESLKPILRSIRDALCTPGEIFAADLSQGTDTQNLETGDLVLSVVSDSLEDQELRANADLKLQFRSVNEPSSKREKRIHEDIISDVGGTSRDIQHETVLPPPVFALAPWSANLEALTTEKASYAEDLSAMILPPILLDTSHESRRKAITDRALPTITANVLLPLISEQDTPANHSSIKTEEGSDMDIFTAMASEVSPIKCSSNSSESSRSKRKRRARRLTTHANKKRKSNTPLDGVIDVSDDDDYSQDFVLSSIVAQSRRRKTNCTQNPTFRIGKAYTSGSTPPSGKRKRLLLEAVELSKMDNFKRRRLVTFDPFSECGARL